LRTACRRPKTRPVVFEAKDKGNSVVFEAKTKASDHKNTQDKSKVVCAKTEINVVSVS